MTNELQMQTYQNVEHIMLYDVKTVFDTLRFFSRVIGSH